MKDFAKLRPVSPHPGRPARRSFLAVAIIAILSALLFMVIELPSDLSARPADISEQQEDQLVRSIVPDAGGLESEPATMGEAEDTAWTKVKVRRGHSLSRILAELGADPSSAYRIINAHPDAAELKRLLPGQLVKVKIDSEGRMQGLSYRIDDVQSLHVTRRRCESEASASTCNEFEVTRETRQFETRVGQAVGRIEESLFVDGQKAGLSDAIIMQLADIFAWDIDFALDLRPGDSFAVVYEEKYWQGQKVRNGSILAAEFINQGQRHRAIAHRDKKGIVSYFTPEGLSLHRAFLRSPMKVSRVTSRFSNRRFHPILKKWRAHKGVDYGAPIGSPIMATADGRVAFAGSQGGYGKTVIIRHRNGYQTLYAHLSRFSRGMKAGKRVEQGQVIGYVGQTGLAKGPHLHYEFQVAGVHRNPLSFKFPQAEPISADARTAFVERAKSLIAHLDALQPSLLAQDETANDLERTQ